MNQDLNIEELFEDLIQELIQELLEELLVDPIVIFRFFDGTQIIRYAEIMAFYSGIFSQHLYFNNREPPKISQIPIFDDPYEPFILMTDLMYEMSIEVNTIETALLLYTTCVLYDFVDGIVEARSFILHLLTEENALMVHGRISMYDDQLILTRCRTEFNRSVLRAVVQTNFFQDEHNIEDEVIFNQALNAIRNNQVLESRLGRAMILFKYLAIIFEQTLGIILPGEQINVPNEINRILNWIDIDESFNDDSGVAIDPDEYEDFCQDRRTVFVDILNEPIYVSWVDEPLRLFIEETLNAMRNEEHLGLQALRGLELLQLLGRAMEKALEIIFPEKNLIFFCGLVALFDV